MCYRDRALPIPAIAGFEQTAQMMNSHRSSVFKSADTTDVVETGISNSTERQKALLLWLDNTCGKYFHMIATEKCASEVYDEGQRN